MPALDQASQAYGLFKTLREISPDGIVSEGARHFRLALIGTPDSCAALRDELLTGATDQEHEESDQHLFPFPATPGEDVAQTFDFLLYLGEEGEPLGLRGPGGYPFSGTLDQVIEAMLELKPHLAIALARRLPRFRVAASNYLIKASSKVNAQFALLTGLPGVVPITEPFLPAAAFGHLLILTKNQIMLIMRLAAAHGHKPGYTRQVKEILGAVANALGWRMVARGVLSFVPAGIGLVAMTAIAYSGTLTVGKAGLFFYQRGRLPTKEEIQQTYAASESEAKAEAERLKSGPAGQD